MAEPIIPVVPVPPVAPVAPVVPASSVPPVVPVVPSDPTFQDKVKGMSQDQLVTAYGEAQKKLGESSAEVGQARELVKQMNVILAAIGDNPEREELVKGWITALDKKAADGEKKPEDKTVDPQVADIRETQQKDILTKFESRYGLDQLPKEKRDEMNKKIIDAMWSGSAAFGQFDKLDDMVKAIPLSKLERFLDNSYYLANKDIVDKTLSDTLGILPGSVGKMSSGSLPSTEELKLNPEQEAVALKLGVTPEDYLISLKKGKDKK